MNMEMKKYTYSTEEQTKKVFELGAELHIIDCDVWLEDRLSAVPSDIPCSIPKMTDYLYHDFDSGNEDMRRDDVVLIEDTEEYGNMVVFKPTLEQMICWLEEQPTINNVNIIGSDYNNWKYDINLNLPDGYESYEYMCREGFPSRKEATLAAIDTALNYLSSSTYHLNRMLISVDKVLDKLNKQNE